MTKTFSVLFDLLDLALCAQPAFVRLIQSSTQCGDVRCDGSSFFIGGRRR
jgi:hypothetical protein